MNLFTFHGRIKRLGNNMLNFVKGIRVGEFLAATKAGLMHKQECPQCPTVNPTNTALLLCPTHDEEIKPPCPVTK